MKRVALCMLLIIVAFLSVSFFSHIYYYLAHPNFLKTASAQTLAYAAAVVGAGIIYIVGAFYITVKALIISQARANKRKQEQN